MGHYGPDGQCALNGCTVSLAGRRRNTRYCCDKHRVEGFRARQALPNGSAPGDPTEALQVLRGWLSALPEKFEDQGYDVEQMIDDLEDELSGLEYEVEEYLAEQETGVEVPAWDLSRRQRARAGSVTNGSEVPDYDPNRSGSVT